MRILHEIQDRFNSFWVNLFRIYSASKSMVVLLITVEIFLGALVVIELGVLSNLVDSTIGARSIGVWTSDMTKGLWQQVIVFMLFIVTIHFKEQFKGVAAKTGRTIRESIFIITAYLASLVASPLLLTVILVSSAGASYIKSRIGRVIYSLIIVLVSAQALSELMRLAVMKGISIGDALWWGGSLLAFAGWIALRPHLPQKTL